MYLKLAWRNIWRNKRRTVITISAIVFAVMVAILMQSVNRGSYEVMIERMVSFNTGYVQIQDYRYKEESSLDNSFPYDHEFREMVFSSDSRIQHVVPRIESFMLAANHMSTRGSVVFGMNPEKERRFNDIENYLRDGRVFSLDEEAVVIARGLADRLQLGVADTLVLIGQGRFGMSASGLFEITGILDHPVRQLNDNGVFMALDTAQRLLSAEGYITGLMIAPGQERHSAAVASSLKNNLEGLELAVYTWPELMPELLELMEMDLATPRLLTFVLYVVIGFGFLGTILTMTLERLKEFGILLSVGMQRLKLTMVMFIEMLFISTIGVITGMAAAWLILVLIDPITLSGDAALAVMDMGYDPVIPMSFAADQFYRQGFFVFLIAVAVFMFPLIKISRLNILDAARA